MGLQENHYHQAAGEQSPQPMGNNNHLGPPSIRGQNQKKGVQFKAVPNKGLPNGWEGGIKETHETSKRRSNQAGHSALGKTIRLGNHQRKMGNRARGALKTFSEKPRGTAQRAPPLGGEKVLKRGRALSTKKNGGQRKKKPGGTNTPFLKILNTAGGGGGKKNKKIGASRGKKNIILSPPGRGGTAAPK